VGAAVDVVNRPLGVVVNVVGERLGVVHLHLSARPQSGHAPELLGQVVLDDLLVDLVRRPDGYAVVLDVDQEVHIVLTTRLESKLVDHSTQTQDLVVAVLVAGPGAENVGVTRKLLLAIHNLGAVLLEAVRVLLMASLLGIGPLDLAVVDLLLPAPDLLRAGLLGLARHLEASLVARVRVAIGAKASETLEADLVVHAELLVRAEERCRLVLGNARVGVDVGQVDLLLGIEEAGLDLVVGLEPSLRLEGVGVEGHRVHGWLLVVLARVRPLLLDVVLGVGAGRVLDVSLLGNPVVVGDEGADTVPETGHSRVVLPVIAVFPLIAAVLHVVLVPPVDAAAEHGRKNGNSDEQGQQARHGETRALHLVDPRGLTAACAP